MFFTNIFSYHFLLTNIFFPLIFFNNIFKPELFLTSIFFDQHFFSTIKIFLQPKFFFLTNIFCFEIFCNQNFVCDQDKFLNFLSIKNFLQIFFGQTFFRTIFFSPWEFFSSKKHFFHLSFVQHNFFAFKWRNPPMEEDLLWKMTSDGRWPKMEYHLQWKTISKY